MAKNEIHAVTGAFGYADKYIARGLLDKGCGVMTLTNSLHREDPSKGRGQSRRSHEHHEPLY